MEQVKFFYAYDLDEDDGDVKDFQKKINNWFKKNPNITVKQRIHTMCDDVLFIAIYYVLNEGLSI